MKGENMALIILALVIWNLSLSVNYWKLHKLYGGMLDLMGQIMSTVRKTAELSGLDEVDWDDE